MQKKLTLRDNILACLEDRGTLTVAQIFDVAYDALGGYVDSYKYLPTHSHIKSEIRKMVKENIVIIVPNFGPRGGDGYKLP